MIDFLEFRLIDDNGRIEDPLERFGEKFLIVGGNMAARSLTGKIYSKILSSLPHVKNRSYIPAKKRIFFDEKDILRDFDVSALNWEEIKCLDNTKIIQYYQENTNFENILFSGTS